MKRLAPIALLLASACAVGPKYQRPEVATPPQYRFALAPQEAASLADLPWWQMFNDPALEALITFVRDRPGHDRRYAIDFSKLRHELAWSPRRDLASGLRETVRFYLGHGGWLERVRTGAYRDWLRENYERR